MALIRSLVFSILASTLATLAVRRIFSAGYPGQEHAHESVVVVVPVITGNSNNRIGRVKEVHHHHHHLFGRGHR